MNETNRQPSTQDSGGLILLLLVLVAFLAVTLIFFGSGWIQVDVG